MFTKRAPGVKVETLQVESKPLARSVRVDLYHPRRTRDEPLSLLLINDGQDLVTMDFASILDRLWQEGTVRPLLCVGIHCGPDRKMEYGTAAQPDYLGRGAKAGAYTEFVFQELLPLVREHSTPSEFVDKSFAGFSLGGLSAIDIVWSHPHEFVRTGVFSGSLWWRMRDLDDGYVEERDRIMHDLIRKGHYAPWLKFFFQTGVLDETADRNKNGIIDSIDDTLGLIDELAAKGYDRNKDIVYLEYADGRHDVPTWARAWPEFLKWGFGRQDDHR